jgi:hypothetical protein
VACFCTRDARRKSDRGAAELPSRYETKVEAGTGRLRVVGGAKLFETSYRRDSLPQRFYEPRTWVRRGGLRP